MTSNKSSNSSFGLQTPKLNFFLVSIQKCSESNPTVYCKYSASLITFGHLCLLFYFPLMFYRMSKLGNRFRNHYNLSFLWLCSLILMFSIDILEFLVTHDQNLYSMVIISATILNITLGFIFSFKYIRTYSKNGAIYKQILTIAFSVSLFVIIIVARVITRKSLLKINKYDQETYTKVHQNIRNNFARTMTNSSYALWILGSFFFIFYSSILPIDPAYDFIHLRNYFLLTTLIVIISQDIYFYRQKKSLDNRLNGFMLKNIKPDMQTNLASNPSKQEKILKFTDNVFNDEQSTISFRIQFLISTGLMFTSVSSPVYRYLTLVIHPLIQIDNNIWIIKNIMSFLYSSKPFSSFDSFGVNGLRKKSLNKPKEYEHFRRRQNRPKPMIYLKNQKLCDPINRLKSCTDKNMRNDSFGTYSLVFFYVFQMPYQHFFGNYQILGSTVEKYLKNILPNGSTILIK
ncbi:hypothetical protein BpHYR1_044484 [Brachionus plicatilis]|uniref:Uncharacterized protein n=1 Tax=Brachionus plicatilis TaxID=10195 RepID=A0A3M7SYQ8_BRAPC|nr:hypothetical protein BpHYR1_044484 [Brachionus plicatilis]